MATVYLYQSEDAYVSSANPTTNYPYSTNLQVGNDGSSGVYRSWLKFDLSSIPVGSTINVSQLVLARYMSIADYVSISFSMDRCTDSSWSENGITWNNAPDASLTGSPMTILTQDGSSVFSAPYLDTTSFVASSLSSRYLSVRLASDNEAAQALMLSYSKDAGSYTYLYVDYTVPPPPKSGMFLAF